MAQQGESAEMRQQRPRDLKREETRRRLLEAALETFRQDGLAGARIDDIAQKVGVSRGTFYFHFPTKEDVVLEHISRTEAEVAAAVDALPAETPLAEVLDRVALSMAEAWQGDPRLVPEVAAVGLRLAATAPLEQRVFRLRVAVASRFRTAVDRGEVGNAPLTPEILSDLYLANVLAGLLAWCSRPEMPAAEILRGVTILFLRGAGR